MGPPHWKRFTCLMLALLLISVALFIPPTAQSQTEPEEPGQESFAPAMETWETTTSTDFEEGTKEGTAVTEASGGALTLDYDYGTKGGEFADESFYTKTEMQDTSPKSNKENMEESNTNIDDSGDNYNNPKPRGNVNGNILMLRADEDHASVVDALTNAGFSVTDGGLTSLYSGSPDPNNFDAVLLLVSNSGGMSAAGETALLNYVADGGGIVVTEWFSLQVYNGAFQTLKPIQCFARVGGGAYTETYTLNMTHSDHPVFWGLPPSFAIPTSSHTKTSDPLNGSFALVTSNNARNAVVAKNYRGGRVIHMATAGTYSTYDPWVDANMARLLSNSVAWVQNNTAPVIQPAIPNPPAVDEDNPITIDLSGYEYDHDDMRVIDLYPYWDDTITEKTGGDDFNDRGVIVRPTEDVTISKIGWYADIVDPVLTANVYNSFWNTSTGRWERTETGGVFDPPIATGILDATGNTGIMAWHDIPLDNPITLQAGQNYDLTVQWGTVTTWYWMDDRVALPIERSGLTIIDGESDGFGSNFAIPHMRTYVDVDNVFSSTRWQSQTAADRVRGFAFTPTEDVTVTAFRHCWGTSVSLWDSAYNLIHYQQVTSTLGYWRETNLSTPVKLNAGETYTLSAYTGGGTYYYNFYGIGTGVHGKINILAGRYNNTAGEASVPDQNGGATIYGVDMVYTWGATTLNWTVSSYDPGAIASISGQNSADDVLTFNPQLNYYGTTTVTLHLTDSQGNYAWQDIDLTWNGVNDPPTTPTNPTNLGTRLTDHTPTVSWTASTDPESDPLTYHVQVSRDAIAWVDQAVGLVATSITLNAITWLDGEKGYWRVRAYDGALYSGWTANDYFRFNVPPTGPPPNTWTALGTRLTDHTPTVSWAAGSDPDGDSLTYYVYLEHGPSGQTTLEAVTANTWAQLNMQSWGGGDWGRWWVVAYDGYEFSDKGYIFSSNTGTARFYTESNDATSFQQHIEMGSHMTSRYGAAIADFNNNGYLDIVYNAYDSSTTEIRLYYLEKTGPNAQFAAPMEVGTVPSSSTISTEMAYGDVNNDGNMDVIASGRSNDIHIFLGNGDGTFNLYSTVNLPGTITARGKSLGDFNNNGNLDLLVATNGDGVFLFNGTGDGTFQPASSTPVVTMPGGINYGVATGDFDGDGNVDAFVSYQMSGDIYFLKGHGDGTFTRSAGAHISIGGGLGYTTIESYRLDRNGELGLLLAEGSGTQTRYYFGDGTGNFTSWIPAINPGVAQSALAAPCQSTSFFAINDPPRMPVMHPVGTTTDQNPTVSWDAVSSNDYGTPDTITYYVYSMNSTGAWALDAVTGSTTVTLNAWNWTNGEWGRWYVVAYDGYEYSDQGFVVTANDAGTRWYAQSNGDGTFQSFIQSSVVGQSNIRGMGIGDFNNNGLLDYVYGASSGSNMSLYFVERLDAGYNFAEPVWKLQYFDGGSWAMDVAVGDFNNNGNMDIAIGANDANIYILLGDGTGGFSLGTTLNTGGSANRGKDVADFDRDGNMDLIVGAGNNILLFRGNGDGTFAAPTVAGTLASLTPYGVGAGDFDGDGFVDFMAAGTDSQFYFFKGYGDGTFNAAGVYKFTESATYTPCNVYDFNRDGNLDMIFNIVGGGRTTLRFGDSTSNFGASTNIINHGITTAYYGIAAPRLRTDYFTRDATPPPDAPTDVLLALAGDWDDIEISWTGGASADYYRVYHSEEGGAWNMVADTVIGTSWVHHDAANDQYYDSYYVQAVNVAGTADSAAVTIYEWVVNATATQTYNSENINTQNRITVYGTLNLNDVTLDCYGIRVMSGGLLDMDFSSFGTTVNIQGNIDVFGELQMNAATVAFIGAARNMACHINSILYSEGGTFITSATSQTYNFWINGSAEMYSTNIHYAGYIGSQGVRINSDGNYFSNIFLRNGGAYGFNLYGNNNTFSNVNITDTFTRGFNIWGQYNEIWDSYINASQYAIICEAAAHYLVVENSMLSGTNQEAAFYVEVAGDNFLIANNTFFDDNTGLSLRGSGHIVRGNVFYVDSNAIYAFSCSNIQIINNTVHGGVFNSGTGIDIASSTDSIISGNNVSDVGGAGARLTSCTNVTVLGNDFINCGLADYLGGVRIYQGSWNFVIGNNLSESYHGVFVLGRYDFEIWTENHEIRDNIMYNVDHVGIYLWRHTRYCTVSNNTVVGSTEAGIRTEGESTGHEIWNNSVSYSGTTGIFVASGTHHVHNNNVSYGESTGIYIASGVHQIRNNSVWLCNGSLEVASGAGAGNIIDNNTMYSNSAFNAVMISRSSTTFSNNTLTHISMSNTYALWVDTMTSFCIIENNTITTEDTAAHGIFVGGGSPSNTIRYNDITTYGGNAKGIFLYSGSDSCDVHDNQITTFGGGSHGIEIYQSNNVLVTYNTVLTEGDNGVAIYVNECSSTTVTGGYANTTHTFGGGAYAVVVYGGSGNVIDGLEANINPSLNGNSAIYVFEHALATQILNSTIYAGANYGIYLSPAPETIIRNNYIYSTSVCMHIAFTSNGKFENNTLAGTGDGIHISQSSGNNVFGNNTMDGLDEGMHFFSTVGAGNVLYNNNITNCTTWGVNMEEGVTVHWYSTALHRIENNPVIMEGNITVRPGGEMIWDNAQLWMSPSTDGQYKVEVQAGGVLRLQSNANFTSTGIYYDFWVNGTIYAENCFINWVGYSGGSYGLRVASSNNLFYNVVMRNFGYHGIHLLGNNNLVQLCNITVGGLGHGVKLDGSNNTIRDSYIASSISYAIYGSSNNWGNIIHNNSISGTNQEATFWMECFAYDLRVTNNLFFDDGYGFSVNGGSNITIANNTFENTHTAIIAGGSDVTITNNTGSGLSQNGITLYGGAAAVVSHNNFSVPGGNGLRLEDYSNIHIFNNSFIDCGDGNYDAGIYLYRSDNALIENNNLSNSRVGLANYGDSANLNVNVTFRNNNIYDADDYGIYTVYSTDFTISHNTIHHVGSASHGIYLFTGTGTVHIENNNISSCTGDGLRVIYGQVTVLNNTFWLNSGIGIRIQSVSGCRVANNTVYSTSGYGVQFAGTTNSWMENNTIFGTSTGILLSASTSGNVIGNNTINGMMTGISISNTAGANNVLYNNNISNCTTWGVHVENGTQVIWYSTTSHRIENNPVRMEGDIIVEDGGELLWSNVNMQFSPGYNGEYKIEVQPGGTLHMNEDSIVESISLFRYDFWVNGTIYAEDCTIYHAGYSGGGSKGIHVNSNNNLFHNVYIREGRGGIRLFGDHNLVQNCNISTEYTAIYLIGNNNTIRDSFINGTAYGINTVGTIWDTKIHNNLISGYGNEGSFFAEGPFHYSYITNNTFFDDNIGLSLHPNNNYLGIMNNTFYTTGTGIQVGGSNLYIINNQASGLSSHGINVYEGQDVVIQENRFTNCGDINSGAIWIQRSANITVDDNIIESSSHKGIFVTGTSLVPSSNITIKHNKITGSGSYGIHLFEHTDNFIIRWNNISSNFNYAVMIESGTHQILDNDMWFCSGAVRIQSTASDGNIIDNNTIFSEAAYNVILVYASSTVVTNNTLTHYSQGNTYCISLSGSSSSLLENNILVSYNLNAYGIFLGSSSNNTVRYNDVTTNGNNAHGIRLFSSNMNRVWQNDLKTFGEGGDGIRLSGSNNNYIENNIIEALGVNSAGTYIHDNSQNNIVGNNTITNSQIGIHIHSDAVDSTLYNNNLMNNTIHGMISEQPGTAWIIDAESRIENNPVNITGYVAVQSGGNMLWKNSLFKISSPSAGQYSIAVNSGGSFFFTEGSKLTSGTSFNYLFTADPGSTLRISDSIIERCGIDGLGYMKGLFVNTQDVLIRNSTFNNNFIGVVLSDYVGPGMPIYNTSFTNNTEAGLLVSNSNWFTLANINFVDNAEGLYISQSHNITVENCIIRQSDLRGLFITYSQDNTIRYNTISQNFYGAYLSFSTDNLFYHNRIIGNNNQALDDGTNIWYNGYPMGGNYWGDHTSPDINIDGYVDNPYSIPGTAGAQDPWPFARDYGWLRLAPSGVTDWVMDWTQRYHNQTISFQGNLVVTSGNLVYFDDNNMFIGDITVQTGTVFNLRNTILHCGRISVFTDGLFTSNPSEIDAKGDVWLDGFFVLDGDTLKMNNTYHGEHNIYVNSTGGFVMKNKALVTAADQIYRYKIVVNPGAVLDVFHSTIQYSGWGIDSVNRGLEISSENVRLDYVTFDNCNYAASFIGTTTVNIYNSTVLSNCWKAFHLSSGADVSAVNTTLNSREVVFADGTSIFYRKWYLNVEIENTYGAGIFGASVDVNDGFGNAVVSTNTNTKGWVRYIICTEYVETHAGQNVHPQPHSIFAWIHSFTGSANAAMNKTVTLTIILETIPFVSHGIYNSKVYGAGHLAFWSYIEWHADIPEGTNVTVYVRTGNSSMYQESLWGDWLQVNTSSGSAIWCTQWTAFIQFKIEMSTSDTNITPIVYHVAVHYSRDVLYTITGQEDFNNGTLTDMYADEYGRMTLNTGVLWGEYITEVLDGSPDLYIWMDISWYGHLPTGTNVSIQTRSGDNIVPDGTWSGWANVNSPVPEPHHRYIQARLVVETVDSNISPVINSIQIWGRTTFGSDTNIELKADVLHPHINNLEILSQHTIGSYGEDVGVTNSRIDVGTSYWIKMDINYDGGLQNLESIQVYLWYDFGRTGNNSVYPVGPMNNTQVALYGDLTTNPHTWNISDDSGRGEFDVAANDTILYDIYNGSFYVRVYFGWQVRAADGDFTEAPGTTNETQGDKATALNDAGTWDMKAVVKDQYGNSDTAYDEFGVYRSIVITSAGLPGNQQGSGPPGANAELSPPGDITFSANCPYRLNVSVTNLEGVHNPSETISAEVVAIRGGNLQGTGHLGTNNFTGPGAYQSLLGNIDMQPPNDSEKYTTTSTAGGGTIAGPVVWVCHIPPGTPEDRYVGTAMFVLLHDG